MTYPCWAGACRRNTVKIKLKTLVLCMLFVQSFAIAQDAATVDQGKKLIGQLAARSRTIPKRELLEELLGNREKHLPQVREAALKGEREARLMALRLLAEIKDPQAARIAGESLDSKDPAIRRRAGSALMLLEDNTQLEKVLSRLPIETDNGSLKALIAAAGSSGRANAADLVRPHLRSENISVRVNAAIALAKLGSMEAMGTILEGLQGANMQARREATYGLGFFAAERQKATVAAQAIIDNPDGLWKSEAGISLLRLELGAAKDKLELLSTASKAGAPRVQAWAIQEIARLGEKESEAWLRQRSTTDDPLGRFAGLQLLLKEGSSNARK